MSATDNAAMSATSTPRMIKIDLIAGSNAQGSRCIEDVSR